MSYERTRRGASRVRDEHGGLDLHKALVIEVASDRADYLRPLYKRVLDLGVHYEVDVSLTVTQIGVRQTVILLGKELKALCEKGDLFRVDRNLAGLRFENAALDADNIADVHLLERGVGLLAERIPRDVALYRPLKILNVAERRLAHDPLRHHSARDGNGLSLERVER